MLSVFRALAGTRLLALVDVYNASGQTEFVLQRLFVPPAV